MNTNDLPLTRIRQTMADFDLVPRIEPNDIIPEDRAFLPTGHRGVLDLRRQLVVGNRGMGKSFWTHALLDPSLRQRLAKVYNHAALRNCQVEIGFNGSTKTNLFAPTDDDMAGLYRRKVDPDLIWRGVLLRIALSMSNAPDTSTPDLEQAIVLLEEQPGLYSSTLSRLDDQLVAQGQQLLIVFDALDRLGKDWQSIRILSRSLLRLAVGLQSFRSIRAKIFMRVDQFSDLGIFQFPDSSKIRNDHVSLIWQPEELYGLLLFEILRDHASGGPALETVAHDLRATQALPIGGADTRGQVDGQRRLIHALAGEFMGSNRKRGLVYTWVPLHLSDAANTCSPRTFLTAWKKAAEHLPAPEGRAVDHLGLLDGVRSASADRLNELYEDYGWIRPSLEALRRQFVPMSRDQLFELWHDKQVIRAIRKSTSDSVVNVPPGLEDTDDPGAPRALLEAMTNVAVMEERSNGKINVPDIFRVEAGILRKGGVAVPRRG